MSTKPRSVAGLLKLVAIHEHSIEDMRRAWLTEKSRAEFLLKELSQVQQAFRNMAELIRVANTISPADVKAAVKEALDEHLRKPKRRKRR